MWQENLETVKRAVAAINALTAFSASCAST
jgi:hypothetical protein